MEIHFLAADKPIIKQYELNPNDSSVIKHPYPFIYEVTSFKEEPKDLTGLSSALMAHAAKGHCMVKGKLGRELVSESRAGTTNAAEPTEWICLDLDGIQDYAQVDDFLSDIGCGHTDYILQWSSSQGIENSLGLRCHIFMQLTKPMAPSVLKAWLMGLNLKVPTLSKQLELTKTGNALKWPLDVTTCQNDKLLYIAPPQLGKGIKNPFPKNNRISFEARTHRKLTFPSQAIPVPEFLKTESSKRIQDLRAKSNLPKIKAKFKFSGPVEYQSNPGEAQITEIKDERGFIYFNLNGGDSWAYYHPKDNPEFIFNFKGEPAYKTQDLLPSYWASLTTNAASGAPDAKGKIYLAFREFSTGLYWNGWYDTTLDALELHKAKSETQLRHFMKNNKMPMGETVPDWSRVFEPNNPDVIIRAESKVNIYNPSEYFKNDDVNTIPKVKACPQTIYKIIDHVIGHDQPTIDHFLNWLACSVQYKTLCGTAWVLQGTQGTGKGLLFHSILTPLFGAENVDTKRMEEIESQFTSFMENKFLVFIDEIEAGRSLYHSKITAKLKNLIVEPRISIRDMYRPAYIASNFTSMIFASNKPASVEISPDDRRFNVGLYQARKISITDAELAKIPSELSDFYAFLMHYKADRNKARTPHINAARANLIDISMTSIDMVSQAIREGDLKFFWDHLPETKGVTAANNFNYPKIEAYRNLVVDLVTTQDKKLTRDELYTVLEYLVGGMSQSPNKFSAQLKHHQLHMTSVWKNQRPVRGIPVFWKFESAWLAQCQTDIAAGLV